MRLDRIYTKIGDRGTTLLAGGTKALKSDLRVEAYGNVDELNASIGILRDQVTSLAIKESALCTMTKPLLAIQHELFDIGAELAYPSEQIKANAPFLVSTNSIERLEKEIDHNNEQLAPLSNFVLPGGHGVNSAAHLSRCVCRRAERSVVRLHQVAEVRLEARIYLNRLSDWLFVLARLLSKKLECEEIIWEQKVRHGTEGALVSDESR